MKIGISLLAALTAMSPQLVQAEATNTPTSTRLEIPVKALLAPQYGFEQKNNIDVVLYGSLPNGCYTLADTQIEKIGDGHTISVRQFANRDSSGICALNGSGDSGLPEHMRLVVPFTNDISIGQLDVGDYNFLYTLENGAVGTRPLQVAKNITSTPDTLPYAATMAAEAPIVLNVNDDLRVTISGVLNSSCTKLNEDVQVMNENDVFVLLPTVHVETGVMCAQVMIPFQKEVNLGKSQPGYHLVQIRSMNGKAVNKVVIITRSVLGD